MTPPGVDLDMVLRHAVVGFDLDLTLLDTRQALVASLRVVDPRLPAVVNPARCLASAADFRTELLRHLADEQIDDALRRYAAAAMREGMAHVRPMPGAVEALRVVRRCGGRSVVVTARRGGYAVAYLRVAGLEVDHLVGGVAGPQKVGHLRRGALGVYIGDHPSDMAAAVAAGVPGVGVTTGYFGADSLTEAGAGAVVASLGELCKPC